MQKDGFVPEHLPHVWCKLTGDNGNQLLEELVASRLIEEAPGGYRFPESTYQLWQVTKSGVETIREAKREAGRIGGQRSGEARREKAATQPNNTDPYFGQVFSTIKSDISLQLATRELSKVAPEHRDAVAKHLQGFRGNLVSEMAKIDYGKKIPAPKAPLQERTGFTREEMLGARKVS